MGVIGDGYQSLDKWFNSSALGRARGGVFDGVGNLAEGIASSLANLLPGELGGALSKGLANSGLDKVFGDAFKNMFLSAKFQAALDVFKQTGEVVAKSWEKADQAAFNYGKRLGMTSAQVKALRDDIIRLGDSGAQFGIKYGKTLDDVIKLQSDFSAELGRNIKLTNSQLKDIAALSAVVGDDMAVKFSAQLENFGVSTSAAGEIMTQMFNKSVKQGISLETYAKNVSDNLQIAQQFTFKRGVDGLTAMAEQAAKMKLDMQQVISLANKLNEGGLEEAVNMSAELQVLGGAFAQFADPIGLLHDSMMDVEGLSDRLTTLVGSMGNFNKDTGKIDINPFQQQQLRAASKSMGLDYGKLIESATQQAKRKEIETQMAGLNNIPEEYKELIMNTAQFQNGVAGVRGANGEFTNLRNLNGADLKKLADFAKTDSENIRDIATMLRGMTDIKEGVEKEKENQRAAMYQSQAEAIKGIYQSVGESKNALQQLVKLELANTLRNSLGGTTEKLANKGIDLAIKLLLGKKEHGGIVKTHSEGDLITNGVPGKEYILNSAQHGEFIVNKQATSHHLGLLRAINADKNGNLKVKQNNDGGVVSMGMPSFGANALSMGQFNGMMSIINLNNMLGGGLFNPQEVLNKRIGKQIDYTSLIKQNLQEQRLNRIELRGLKKDSAAYNKLSDKILKLQTEKQNLVFERDAQQLKVNKITAENAKIASKISKGVKIGGSAIAGVSAGISSWQGYKADGTDVMNRGKALGGTIGSAVGATAGAALGAFAGPIGMMIGGAIGEFAGKAIGEAVGSGNQVRRNNKRVEFAEGLGGQKGNALMTLKGDFSTSELRKIKDGLSDGKLREHELDAKLVEKIKRSGNEQVLTRTYARGGLLKGRSHAEGGIAGPWYPTCIPSG